MQHAKLYIGVWPSSGQFVEILHTPTFTKSTFQSMMEEGRLRSVSAVYKASKVTIPIGITEITPHGTSNVTSTPFSLVATSTITVNETNVNDMFTESSGNQQINQSLINSFSTFG